MAKKLISFVDSVKQLFSILRLDRKDISAIYIYAMLAGLVQLSLPLGIQTILSFVMAGSISTSIVVLIIMVVMGTFLYGLMQVRQMQIIEKVQQKIFVRYSLEFSDRLPKLDIEKLDKYYLPELVNRFFETPALQKGIDKLLLDIPTAVIQIVFGLILLAFYHPVFIGFGAILLTIVLLIIRFSAAQGLETSLAASDYKYSIASWLEEMARVIKSFKYSKGTNLHIRKADNLITNYLHRRTQHFKILMTQYWSLISFKIIITAAMLIVGATLLVNQQINIGQFIAADIVIIAIINSVEKLITNLDVIYSTLTSVEKLNKITDSEVEKEGSALLAIKKEGVSVKFDNVSFAYSDGNEVLHTLNFNLMPGQLIALMGNSGSGKSTILRLLTGAFKNYAGNVLVDGVPIGNYNLQSLRSQTGILLSQQDIFQGTLMENITMGNTAITAAEITRLAEKIGFIDFVQSHKEGYDTMLDPQGKKLSKKVRQDILLLRALLGHHRLLLLEEPFDHLEESARKGVLEFLKSDKSATIILTTIDPTVADQCDEVIMVKDGNILGKGPWAAVKNEAY